MIFDFYILYHAAQMLAQQSRRVVIAGSLLSWLAFALWIAHGHAG